MRFKNLGLFAMWKVTDYSLIPPIRPGRDLKGGKTREGEQICDGIGEGDVNFYRCSVCIDRLPARCPSRAGSVRGTGNTLDHGHG